MDIFKTFALDETALDKGVWRVMQLTPDGKVETVPVQESEIGDRQAVLVASTDNPKYEQLVNAKKKPYLMKQRNREEPLPPEVRDRIIGESLADSIILDWRNFRIGDQEWAYSKEAVMEIWTRPKWTRLRDVFLAMIGDVDVFKVDQEEATVKNS